MHREEQLRNNHHAGLPNFRQRPRSSNSGRVDVELDSRVLAIPKVGTDALGQFEMSNLRGTGRNVPRELARRFR